MAKVLTEKISLWQLFILIFIFEMGSAIIVGIGNDAKQDAWIAVGVGSLFGVGLILFYHRLIARIEGKNLFELFEYAFGKWIGRLLTIIYVIYFFYIAARVLRDFGELLTSSILPETPIEVLMIILMLVISYVLYLGIEVLGRTSEIFMPYVLLFLVGTGIGIFFSGEMEFVNLLPILPEGIKPIITAVFPSLLTFPFGELVVFTMIMPYVSNSKYVGKVAAVAVSVSGVILVYSSIVQIATLGFPMKNRSNFPLLSAAREISLLNFIERIDLLIVFIVMFGVIIKVGIFMYAGLKGLELVCNRPYRYFIIPIGILIADMAMFISDNFAEHLEVGLSFVPMYLHIPLQLVLPFLIFPIILWKTKGMKGGQQHDQSNKVI